MRRLLQSLELPLLRKELVELAARKRTYVLRVFFSLLVILFSYSTFAGYFAQARMDPVSILGTAGANTFQLLFSVMLVATCIFVPALACGSISSEKERNTIGLLFLSRLGPWAIIFEKLLSRLIPVFSFLLVSMPLFAIAFSFGGVDLQLLWIALALLMVVAFMLASVSIMCSAYCRTSSGAFMASYLIGFFLLGACIQSGLSSLTVPFGIGSIQLIWMLYTYGPSWLGLSFKDIGSAVLPSVLLVIPIALLFSRYFLVRRAFLRPRQLLLRFFKYMDSQFFKANDKFTGGIVLVKDTVGLPDDQPIAWRETRKRTLGTLRYLFRVFLAIELPIVVVCLFITLESVNYNFSGVSVLLLLTWSLISLLLSVQAGGLIASERTHETLAPLLTTNLSSRQIVLQKYAGIRRAILVLRVPLLTVLFFQLGMKVGYRFWASSLHGFNGPLYTVCFLLSAWIFPHMVGWLGVFFSLRLKTQSRAVVTTVTVLAAWCLVPGVVSLLLNSNLPLYASPGMILVQNESNFGPLRSDIFGGIAPDRDQQQWVLAFCWVFVIGCFTFYGGLTLWLRHVCLTTANVALGRGEVRQSGVRRSGSPAPETKLALADST